MLHPPFSGFVQVSNKQKPFTQLKIFITLTTAELEETFLTGGELSIFFLISFIFKVSIIGMFFS